MTIAKDIQHYSDLQKLSEDTGNKEFAKDVGKVLHYAERYKECLEIAEEIGDHNLKNYIQRRWKLAKKQNIR